jgi:hypothetical protein
MKSSNVQKVELVKLNEEEQRVIVGGVLEPITVGLAAAALLNTVYDLGKAIGRELYHVRNDKP